MADPTDFSDIPEPRKAEIQQKAQSFATIQQQIQRNLKRSAEGKKSMLRQAIYDKFKKLEALNWQPKEMLYFLHCCSLR